jgi:hypothetical protein
MNDMLHSSDSHKLIFELLNLMLIQFITKSFTEAHPV